MVEEPLLVLLFVTLLAWVLLLLGLPELLFWLAARNIRQRRQLVQAVRRQEKGLKSILRQLEPFQGLQATQYRQTYEMTRSLLDSVQSSRRALVTMNGLRFPHLPAAGWPIRHFLSHRRDATDIVNTWRRLRQLQRSVEAGNRTLAQARAQLQQLHQVPEKLQKEVEALLARLSAVHDILQEEQREGIVVLRRWQTEHRRLQQSAQGLQQRLGSVTDIPLQQADQLGQELDHLGAALAQLEKGVQALHQDRQAFDARRQMVVVALSALGDLPPSLKPVADVTKTLLAETADLRRNLAFDQAEPLLKTCEQWIELGKIFQTTEAMVGQLRQQRDDALNPSAISQVSDQLQEAYQNLASLDVLAGRQAYAPLPAQVNGAVASIAERLVQIQKQAGAVQEQYKREAREQDQIAKGQAHELVKAWNSLRRVVKLANNEQLAERYHSLMQQRPAASGKPAQLRAWAVQAAEVRQDILESAGYLQYRLNLIGQWMNQLAAFLKELDTSEATVWRCLQPQVAAMKQVGQGLQEGWKNVRKSGRLDEIHQKLDDIKLQYQQLQQDYQEMEHRLYQLSQMDGRIQETVAVIQETAYNIDPTTLDRMMELINSNYERAYQVATYEEAIAALQRAEEFVNKLAMG